MKKVIYILFITALVLTPLLLQAKEVSPPYTLTLGGRGGYIMPMGSQKDVLNGGINASIFLNYNPKLINNFLIQPEFSYSGFRLTANKDVLSSYFAFGINASYNIPILKFLEVNTIAGGGYYMNRLVENNTVIGKSYNPYIKASVGIDINIIYNFNMNASANYINYLAAGGNSTSALSFTGAVNYRFGKNPAELNYDRSIEIKEVKINPLFSALYKYYETAPAGRVTIANISKNKEVKNIKASVMVKDFMDYPTASKVVESIKPGETVTIDLHMLFSNKVLSVTEDTPLSANIKVDYVVSDREFSKEDNVTFQLYNRNAMTWSDDRKLASFITPKDPPVKVFARTVLQQYKANRINVLNQNLQTAVEIFDALGTYGLTYVVDPKTPFTKLSAQKDAVDYVQYPRETLRFKTGDCDDLTTLYCSLLENVGISTAFITIPGHIFMMFDTGISRYDFREITDDRGLIIEKNGNIWVPVEITMPGEPFIRAWQEAAKEYNRSVQKGDKIGLYLTADAWSKYVPVTLEDFGWEPEVPEPAQIASLYNRDIEYLVGRELKEKVAKVKTQLSRDPQNPKLYNRLGIIYARYGQYDKALKNLNWAVSLKNSYVAAINNLGNVYYLLGNYDKALEKYKSALKYNISPIIMINLAKTSYKLGDYSSAKKYYDMACSKNKRYEKKYAYLGRTAGGGEVRAVEAAKIEVMVEWDYE